MECTEEAIDLRETSPELAAEYRRDRIKLHRLNHAEPDSEEYTAVMRELFRTLGEGSVVRAPVISVAHAAGISIGRNVFINGGALFMARGGITIEDNVQIAANVQLISNNHDVYDRSILLCKPVLIREGAWIGAGATILPGVCIGRHAVVGAASVVTKDVPDYGVVVGNPAKVIKLLDPARFR